MMQSQKFPSIFLHGYCRAQLFQVIEKEGFTWNSLVSELIFDDSKDEGQ